MFALDIYTSIYGHRLAQDKADKVFVADTPFDFENLVMSNRLKYCTGLEDLYVAKRNGRRCISLTRIEQTAVKEVRDDEYRPQYIETHTHRYTHTHIPPTPHTHTDHIHLTHTDTTHRYSSQADTKIHHILLHRALILVVISPPITLHY